MKRLAFPHNKNVPYILILITYMWYVILFALFRNSVGVLIGELAIIPVIGASWYFGSKGGVFMAALCVLNNIIQPMIMGEDVLSSPPLDAGEIIGFFVLTFTAYVVGNLKSAILERSHALIKLEQYEWDRRAHTDFLERLNEITGTALEADSLDATLNALVEGIGRLFNANDCFFSVWDETKGVPIPTAAYGSMSDIYPYIQFEPGEQTLTTSVIEVKEPIAVTDIENSPYISPNVAAIFPSRSMLSIPLIVHHRKLGAVLLGYNESRSFNENEMSRARIAADQIASVVSKSLLLEEERKQVRQLTALHDIALIAIDVDNEDELIHRVTDVIGQNLFPDNFGILLLDEQTGILHPHPSYRFSDPEERCLMEVSCGEGITGHVAETGQPQRIGNVRCVKDYVDMDDRTISELCVPIKFKERILGVINTESTKRDAFTEDDERLLVTLAGQIATAMEQIRRAQAERKWLDQLAHSNDLIYALAQITTHIEKAFSIEDIIQNLGIELRKIDLTCIMAAYDKEPGLFTIKYTSMEPQLLDTVENSLGHSLLNHTFPGDKLTSEALIHPTV
jgi:GAF domain-containing protein